jgi:hypothetical protein
MRLERTNDDALRSKVGRPVARRHSRDLLQAPDPQTQAVMLDGSQMSAAGDDTDLVARKRKLHGEIAADGSGTKYAYFHGA